VQFSRNRLFFGRVQNESLLVLASADSRDQIVGALFVSSTAALTSFCRSARSGSIMVSESGSPAPSMDLPQASGAHWIFLRLASGVVLLVREGVEWSARSPGFAIAASIGLVFYSFSNRRAFS
jgi:hypothetical protein